MTLQFSNSNEMGDWSGEAADGRARTELGTAAGGTVCNHGVCATT